MEIPKLFNKSEIARFLYPEKSDAAQRLHHKVAGTKFQRLTEKDKAKIAELVSNESMKFVTELFQKST